MSEMDLALIAGLGNPGKAYLNTRHNAGFLVIDELARLHNIEVRQKKFDTVFGRGDISGRAVMLVKPQAYMNRSGPPVQQLAAYFRIQRKAIVVVHDDIDLAFTRLKIKEKGGDGGHRGIRSLISALGGDDFIRVRLGIGRSEYDTDASEHVLGNFNSAESEKLEAFLQRACEAIETIVIKGTKEGMNRFNQNPR